MIGALIYLVACSVKNALLARLRRLRQPKYFFGAIVGGFYVYFVYFRNIAFTRYSRGAGGYGANHLSPDLAVVIEFGGAALLMAVVALKWLLPEKRAALDFTEAEIAFLFPAPVSRRMLVQYKLVRSQLGILFSAVLMTLFTGRFRSGTAMISALGWWLGFSTLNLHFIAASFTHARLLDCGISSRKRRLITGVVFALVALGLGFWLWKFVPRPTLNTFFNLKDSAAYLNHAFFTGPAFFVTYPFRLFVQPFVARDLVALLSAVIPIGLILWLHYWWIIHADVAFEEASLAAAQKRSEIVAAARSGKLFVVLKKKHRRNPFFKLAPSGFEPMAILWKNLISADQTFSRRFWLTLAALAIFTTLGISNHSAPEGIGVAVGTIALSFAGMSLLLGPQMLRYDLRQDLAAVDILKLYPLPGWKIVLGELLAPAVILTVVQWFLILIAVICFQLPYGTSEGFGLPQRIAFGFAIAIILPFLNLFSLVIINAATLMFPAWVQLGPTAQRGFEVMGQQLIGMLGQVLVMLVALFPVAVVTGGIVYAGKIFGFLVLSLPIGAIAGAVILAAEVGVAVFFLGKLFERFDLSAEPPL